MQIDYDRMTRDFILNESQEPGLLEYLNVLSEMIGNFKPMRESDRSRLAVMKENLRKARKHARMMQERLSLLEEQVKIIEEVKNKEDSLTDEEIKKYKKANVYAMDVEVDGGTLPDWIQKMMHASYKPTTKEKRKLIKWFYENAPGNY